jgi:hypothetical protein
MEEITEPIAEPITEPIAEPIAEPITEPIIEERKPKITASRSPGEDRDGPCVWHLAFLRNTRNSYLNSTDKYILPDYPISEEKKEIIMNYRQYLREFININQETILNGAQFEIDPIPII